MKKKKNKRECGARSADPLKIIDRASTPSMANLLNLAKSNFDVWAAGGRAGGKAVAKAGKLWMARAEPQATKAMAAKAKAI